MTVEVTFLGHAAVKITSSDTTLLIDPWLEGNPLASVKPDEVEADYIAVTHGHGDHMGDAEGIARRTGATVIANAEIAGFLGERGVDVHALHIGGGHDFQASRGGDTVGSLLFPQSSCSVQEADNFQPKRLDEPSLES